MLNRSGSLLILPLTLVPVMMSKLDERWNGLQIKGGDESSE